jgi:putative ABC transport system permease protein
MMHAIKSSYRSFRSRPGFFFAAVVTMTLCIGANSAIFSLIDAVLLKPLPYVAPAQLVALFETNVSRKTGTVPVAPCRLDEWNVMNRSFDGIGGVYMENITETSGALPEKLLCARTSPRFFSVLGIMPLLGREFTPDEERFGGPRAALISEAFWRRRFAGGPDVVGRSLRVENSLYPIAGVLPSSFRMPITNTEVDVWLPAALPKAIMENRETRFYLAVARLKEGISVASAQAVLKAMQARLAAQYPATDAQWTPVVKPPKEVTVGRSGRGLWTLFGAVTLVLLIGCANIACLLLTQAQRRAREMAIRFSLGGRRRQVIRQLLLEAFLVALPGAILGLVLSAWGTDLLRAIASEQLPRGDEIRLSWPLVWFTLSLSVATTFLFGLIPALAATRTDTAPALAHSSRTQTGGSGQTLLRLLVGSQVALAIVLLISAGLLIRTISTLAHVPLGFQTCNVLTLHISASWGEKRDFKRVQHRLEQTLEALENIPGVESAALTLNPPGAGANYNLEFHVAGRNSDAPGEKLLANAAVVSSSYFRTLGIPLLAGRVCRDNIDTSPQESVISRHFAERFFPNESPIGHTLQAGQGSATNSTLIVGVVENARDTNRAEQPEPVNYWCTAPGFWPDPIFLLKTQGPPMALANTLRERIKRIEPARAVYDIASLDEQLSSGMTERKLQTVLLSLFGLSALLLAVVGLYGVLGFYVSQRTREIGLRVALGARPAQIFSQIFQQGALMTVAGVVAGLATGAALTKLIVGLLYGVSRWDSLSFFGAPALLIAVAALAIWIPSRRAMRVDPIVALREE